MAYHLGFSEFNQERMERAGQWHDAGKLLVPECNSEAELSDVERERITKAHSDKAPQVLAHCKVEDPWIWQAAMLHHHDWQGDVISVEAAKYLFPYMEGRFLAGTDIPEPARIVRPADFFVGHMERRKHRSKIWTMEEVIEKLKRDKGRKFDPTMVEIFLSFCLVEAVTICAYEVVF
jgi:putative two-component system response regulator